MKIYLMENMLIIFQVTLLSRCLIVRDRDILDDSKGLILVATVGKFNQKDKEDGDRKIFQTGLDEASESLWEILKRRENDKGKQRELIIVYDEGQ